MSAWARHALATLLSALSACASPPPAQPAAPAPSWPGDGLPGLIPDLQALLASGALPRERRPAAMLRLAALLEERAAGTPDDGAAAALAPAVEQYERLLREYPEAREATAARYHLGHALDASGKPIEAARAWRSLVCGDRYPYPVPAAPAHVELPQDHDGAFWAAWARQPSNARPEATFVDPFPESCHPAVGAERPALAEVWWRLAEQSFDGVDPRAGPYHLNRAVSAYRRAIAFADDPVRVVILYKLAWTYRRQERYAASVQAFVQVLQLLEAQEKRAPHSALDMLREAATYIAGALTEPDLIGPPAGDPFQDRPHPLDGERDPRIAEQKTRVGIARAQDPRLLPQDAAWLPDVIAALAREYEDLAQPRNAVEAYDLLLGRWPAHERAAAWRAAIVRARAR